MHYADPLTRAAVEAFALDVVIGEEKAGSEIAGNSVIVTTQKNTAGTGRVFNPNKPPAIRGYKWSQKGVGFDCRKVTKNGDVYIAHLGKKKLSDFRSQSADREELRELVRNWILEKESEKGK